ncbi:MAG: hypothetical protein JJ900_06510 [Rhodospirillales bacterium]|nr:hypothetical protein [Rhodospirillales bacterium]MBO6786488.1 hypothetical protein [Rhodospirillales bacterium]
MSIMNLLRSPRFAFVCMAFFVACGIVFGFRWFGWMGVGFVGLVGLMISMRAEIFETCGDPHERASTHTVQMLARQRENERMENPDARRRREGEAIQRYVFHRVINAVFAAILMLGGSMFFLKEF